ncbi:hypothetical protein PIB30_076188 [Stylosanthes scabra]|uniref:Uncharacterized protein n=1 Tax=Stylosanthes scabra TaxID=79078 RepID=A0ABU6YMQ8_9FABA|nr:hypothetical protein [Stylosanthes scabra]
MIEGDSDDDRDTIPVAQQGPSNHEKYHGKHKEFDKGCNLFLRVSNLHRKGHWEVMRADATVTIKVLRRASESSYGFIPSYRKLIMPRSVAELQTSPVRVGDVVDESVE